jgi:hypothetical protein
MTNSGYTINVGWGNQREHHNDRTDRRNGGNVDERLDRIEYLLHSKNNLSQRTNTNARNARLRARNADVQTRGLEQRLTRIEHKLDNFIANGSHTGQQVNNTYTNPAWGQNVAYQGNNIWSNQMPPMNGPCMAHGSYPPPAPVYSTAPQAGYGYQGPAYISEPQYASSQRPYEEYSRTSMNLSFMV